LPPDARKPTRLITHFTRNEPDVGTIKLTGAELCQVYQARFEQRATDLETFFKPQGADWRSLATDSELSAALW
jgi:hypothetical protein